MADYFARVELHGARWPDDYAVLHQQLLQHNFTSCVLGTQGNSRLPTGFYHSTNRVDDINVVVNAVRACADATGFKSEVIVIRDTGWSAYLNSKC